jgi:hypothetical protein
MMFGLSFAKSKQALCCSCASPLRQTLASVVTSWQSILWLLSLTGLLMLSQPFGSSSGGERKIMLESDFLLEASREAWQNSKNRKSVKASGACYEIASQVADTATPRPTQIF